MEKKKSKSLSNHKKPESKTTRSLNFKTKRSLNKKQEDMDPNLHFGKVQKGWVVYTRRLSGEKQKSNLKLKLKEQPTIYQRPQPGKQTLWTRRPWTRARMLVGMEEIWTKTKEKPKIMKA